MYFFSQNFICCSQIEPTKVQIFWLATAHVKFHFVRLLLLKIYRFQLKKYRGVLFHYTEEWRKIWKKLICSFKNDKNLVKFDPSTQFYKICTSIGSFCAMYITFVIKKYRGVILTLRSDAKFEEKLTCGLENDRNLVHFHQSNWTSQNWDFDGILSSKVGNVWA